ncbi:MAG: hypothetical protein Q9M91_07550 [Candidatus Dojkabacteria bacterium]|nr:hypothetical protein [Candidatus Dojkabacteria bacterium]
MEEDLYYLPNQPFRTNIAEGKTEGEKLIVEGYLLDSDCSSQIKNAVIDIWQASAEGEYEDEFYRGQIKTDKNGYYKFETVMPVGYGEGTAYRPPHIHFKVFIDNKEIVTSQMFFSDVEGRDGFNDEYIINVKKADKILKGNYNIVLPDYNK